ncbi:MAG TPA: mannosyltransferase family protein [Candidatus Bathyarchaeia archaeon]|nr:mannosyltransferase family protein [Candidatus Bathyarchaeia archaeon]
MVALRVVYAEILYRFLNPAVSIHSVVKGWLYLFTAWDSEHYITIARSWYPHVISPEWGFFPLYPALLRVLSLVGLDVPVTALVLALSFGFVSIVIFQKIAEFYLTRKEAFQATLLYFLLPPVFVFCGVSYAEPLFLALSMLCWYCHIYRKDVWSCVAAALASLVRPYGILLIVPLGIHYVFRRQWRNLAYSLIAPLTVAGWMIYSFLMTGTFAYLASLETYWQAEYSARIELAVQESLRGHVNVALGNLLVYAYAHVPVLIAGLVALSVIAVLSFRTLNLDTALGWYSVLSVFTIFLFGLPKAFVSFPRYLGFIFPIGLVLYGLKAKAAFACLVILAVLDYLAWYAFLTDSFF